jgi:hypothetical protein
MQRLRLTLLYVACAPWDLTLLLLSPLWWLLGVRAVRCEYGVLWLDIAEHTLLHRHFQYSITLGHLVVLQPGLRGSDVERHELVHVDQYEGAVCSVWLAAACGLVAAHGHGLGLALAVCGVFAPWWSYAGASLAACLRSERPYLDNAFERHARAETAGAQPRLARRS